MKTITPFELQKLMETRRAEVIDVRPKEDFDRGHAVEARSVPLKVFEPHSVLGRRRGNKGAPLYIIAQGKAQASLVVCALAAAGLEEAIVVDGGLEAWEAECLPLARTRSWPSLRFAGAVAWARWSRRLREFLHSCAGTCESPPNSDRSRSGALAA